MNKSIFDSFYSLYCHQNSSEKRDSTFSFAFKHFEQNKNDKYGDEHIPEEVSRFDFCIYILNLNLSQWANEMLGKRHQKSRP